MHRPLETAASIHEVPTRVTHHALAGQAGQRQEALHGTAQRALHRRLPVDSRAAQFEDLPVEITDHQPGVARELVTYRIGRIEQVTHRVCEGTRTVDVDDEVEEFGVGLGHVVDVHETRVRGRDRCKRA